jgi:hypothetical protein
MYRMYEIIRSFPRKREPRVTRIAFAKLGPRFREDERNSL